jgi:hypothetical protein
VLCLIVSIFLPNFPEISPFNKSWGEDILERGTKGEATETTWSVGGMGRNFVRSVTVLVSLIL